MLLPGIYTAGRGLGIAMQEFFDFFCFLFPVLSIHLKKKHTGDTDHFLYNTIPRTKIAESYPPSIV